MPYYLQFTCLGLVEDKMPLLTNVQLYCTIHDLPTYLTQMGRRTINFDLGLDQNSTFYFTENDDKRQSECCILLDTKDGINIHAQLLGSIEQRQNENAWQNRDTDYGLLLQITRILES